MLIIAAVWLLLGWAAGVGINYMADELPRRRERPEKPACQQCGRILTAVEWSGLLALVSQRTHCPACGAKRSRLVRSAVVEILTPVLFGLLWWRYGLSLRLGLDGIYTVVLLLITVTDLEHRLIFNHVTLPAILFAVVAAFFTPDLPWKLALLGGAVGFVLVYAAALVSRGGLGGGDVVLSAFLGLIVGFPYILLNLLFGVFLGGFTALALLLTRRVGLKSYIPYGPFLTISGWLMLVWREELWDLYFR